MITIVLVEDEWEPELDRLEREPGPATRAQIASHFEKMHFAGIADTHVLSGRLKATITGQGNKDLVGDELALDLKWGNADDDTPGMVDYAWYEQRREDGHDFTKGVDALADGIADIMLRSLRG